MIRERRNRDKLEYYYEKFIKDALVDPNVHPWVAASWLRSRDAGISHDVMPPLFRLTKEQLLRRQAQTSAAIQYMNDFYQEIREFFNIYNLSLLLLDADCYVLKSYSLPFFQNAPGQIEGARMGEEDIGTSSISIAYEHKTPFLLFGPEMWVKECQQGDACSAPVMVDGKLAYMITLVSVKQQELPYSSVVSLLLGMKYSMQCHLSMRSKLKAQQAILDAAPFAVYHVAEDGQVGYSNRLGKSRLRGIGGQADTEDINLNDVVLNYRHTPIFKGFDGIPSYNKEVTWITQNKTYEDITTVVPLEKVSEQQVGGVVVISLPIEDLRTLIAHAVGYTARYSLTSMVGSVPVFAACKDRAGRLARSQHHLLLQGEPGTGKERMAHGVHQASSRAAGPLITLNCSSLPPEVLEEELFGVAAASDGSRPGKLELADGGTLFLDEIEKLPRSVALVLASALTSRCMKRLGEDIERLIDVRIVAACDSDLKRLTERGVFEVALYEIVSKGTIKLPSLRSRREDIPVLAAHIINEVAQQHQLPTKVILPETAQSLMVYDWPGNIKQLQAVMEQAFFYTAGAEITASDINLMGPVKLDMAWKEDRDIFVKALEVAGGNISRLANMLDVSRVTLYRYLRKYGLDREHG